MSLFAELKRRNVIKVAVAYIIVGWLVMQIGEVMAPALRLPGWVLSTLAFFVILGFPFTLIIAWAFEMTPEGLKLEKEIDRSKSISHITGRKLDFAIIGLMAVALAYFAYDKFVLGSGSIPDQASAVTESVDQELNLTPVSAAGDDRQSIAVLPFANRSNLEEDLFFTDGIHDDLLTQLAKINDLKVISRTSVMNYRDTEKRIPEIARELGVATILEGGVQRAGDRVRINTQLIDVTTDEHLWAETFDREMTVENIFEIQSEITRHIVKAVRGELSSEESAALAQLPTHNLEAYEALMRARAIATESAFTAEKWVEVQEWVERAVSLDPGFTLAWSLLVETHAMALWIGFDTSDERRAALDHALEQSMANPDSGEAQYALGQYLYRIKGDYPAALVAFKAASRNQPGNAEFMYQQGATYRRLGQFDETVDAMEHATRLDPANAGVMNDYTLTLLLTQDYERGMRVAKKAVQRLPQEDGIKSNLAFMHINAHGDIASARQILDSMTPAAGYEYTTLVTVLPLYERNYEAALAVWNQPELIQFNEYRGNPQGWRGRWLGEIHHLQGNDEKAASAWAEFIETESTVRPPIARNRAIQLANLALAHAGLGNASMAKETMEEAVATIESIGDHFAGAAISGFRARMLALVGERELALEEIERLIHTPGSYLTPWSLTLDPRWDFMRDDERFNELIRPEGVE